MDAIAELDQLTDSLAGTITALRGLYGDAQKENAELATTVSSVADGLSSIQINVEEIRRLFAGLQIKSEGDGNDRTVFGVMERCGPKFRTGLATCVSMSGVVVERLDVVVVLSEPGEEWGNESDWGSLADSVMDVKSTMSNQLGDRDEILQRVMGVVGPLSEAWSVIVDALEANQPTKGSSSRPGAFDSGISREVFRRLEKSSTGLSLSNRESRGAPWAALFRPFRLKDLLGKSSNDDSPTSPDRSLTKTKTWPSVLLKSNFDPEAAEARKRSANIDKQIQADSVMERKKCSLMLLCGSRESRVVLTDTFAVLNKEENSFPAVIDPTWIRESLLNEVCRMTDIVSEMEEPKADELVYLQTFQMKRRGSNRRVDAELVDLLTKLWSLESCPKASLKWGRPRVYDKMVLDVLSRSIADDYLPTLADHRRFSKTIVRNFTFNFDPISVNLIDYCYLTTRGRRPQKLLGSCIEDSTSFIVLIDLAQYDVGDCEATSPWKFGLRMMNYLTSKEEFRRSRASIVLIFHNVKEFRASLKENQFSASYPDFAGKNDAREAISYLMKKAIAACGPKTKIYPYVGELTSRSTVRFILAAAKETMLHRALVEAGFF